MIFLLKGGKVARKSLWLLVLVVAIVGLAGCGKATDTAATSVPAKDADDRGVNPLRDIFDQGFTYAMEGDYDKAIAEITKIIQSNPENGTAYLLRGHLHASNKDFAKAISDYNRAIRLTPENAEAYVSRGLIHSRHQDYDSAVADFDKAIELGSEDWEVYIGRSAILVLTDEFERSIEDLDKAIELNPNLAYAYRLRGIAYSTHSEDYDRAIADFDKAIALSPDDATAYQARGMTWFLAEEYDKAIADFDSAIALDPDIAEARSFRRLSEVLRTGSLSGWDCVQHSEWVKEDEKGTIVEIYDIEEIYRSPERLECIGRAKLQNGVDAAVIFQIDSNGDNSYELTESLAN